MVMMIMMIMKKLQWCEVRTRTGNVNSEEQCSTQCIYMLLLLLLTSDIVTDNITVDRTGQGVIVHGVKRR